MGSRGGSGCVAARYDLVLAGKRFILIIDILLQLMVHSSLTLVLLNSDSIRTEFPKMLILVASAEISKRKIGPFFAIYSCGYPALDCCRWLHLDFYSRGYSRSAHWFIDSICQ